MSIATMRQTDRKYDAPLAVELPDPGELAGYDSGAGVEESDLVVTYFDTVDLRLFEAGITTCRQTGGPDPGWHLKLPLGADSHTEVLLPLNRGSRPPEELVRLVRVHTRDEPLVPIAELTTRRRGWRLVDPSAGPAADVIDDHVVFNLLSTESMPQIWHEVELKLAAEADPAVLNDIERALNGIGLRPAPLSSRVDRALVVGLLSTMDPADDRAARALVKPPRLRVRPSTRADDVVIDYIRRQAVSLRHYDPLVRCDSPDAVHQMRVAARRMRSGLQTYPRVLDPERTHNLVAELRWLSGELSAARDGEVSATRLVSIFDALPPDLALEPGRADLHRDLQRRAYAAREIVLAALNSDRYLNLQRAIDERRTRATARGAPRLQTPRVRYGSCRCPAART